MRPALTSLASLCLAASAHAAPGLQFTGTCPGAMTVAVTDATPSGPLAVVGASGPGTTTVPSGSCAGTQLDISGNPTVYATPQADAAGRFRIDKTFPGGLCGRSIQVLDLTTCATSNVFVPGNACADADADGVCDADDACPGSDDWDDADGDGAPDACDLCPGEDDTVDVDGDGIPDACDPEVVGDCPTAFLPCGDTCTFEGGVLNCTFATSDPEEPILIQLDGSLLVGGIVGQNGTACCYIEDPSTLTHIDVTGSPLADEMRVDIPEGSGLDVVVTGGNLDDLIVFDDCDTTSTFTLLGAMGNDVIQWPSCPVPPAANITADGGEGNDTIVVHGDGIALGSSGDDDIRCTMPGDCDIDGGLGNDILVTTDLAHGRGDNDTISCADDIDGCTMYGESGDDVMIGGAGDDYLRGDKGFDEMHGGAGNDEMRGNDDDDIMYGDDGDDEMYGFAHNDTLYGGEGNDFMKGGSGDDVLEGQRGDDQMWGESGIDTLIGSWGMDWLEGGSDTDYLFGEDDADVLFGDCSDANCTAASDEVYGGGGDDQVYGDCGPTNCGLLGNDFVSGDSGNDLVYGDEGDDIVKGGSGNDTVDGGAGDDMVFGNSGVDGLLGGFGDDLLCEHWGEGDTLNGQGDFDTMWYGPSASTPPNPASAGGEECGDANVWAYQLGPCNDSLVTAPWECVYL